MPLTVSSSLALSRLLEVIDTAGHLGACLINIVDQFGTGARNFVEIFGRDIGQPVDNETTRRFKPLGNLRPGFLDLLRYVMSRSFKMVGNISAGR